MPRASGQASLVITLAFRPPSLQILPIRTLTIVSVPDLTMGLRSRCNICYVWLLIAEYICVCGVVVYCSRQCQRRDTPALTTHHKYCIAQFVQDVCIEDKHRSALLARALIERAVVRFDRDLVIMDPMRRAEEIPLVASGCLPLVRELHGNLAESEGSQDRFHYEIPNNYSSMATSLAPHDIAVMDRLYPGQQPILISSSMMHVVVAQLSLIYDCMALYKSPRTGNLRFAKFWQKYCDHKITSSRLVDLVFDKLVDLHVVDFPLAESKIHPDQVLRPAAGDESDNSDWDADDENRAQQDWVIPMDGEIVERDY